YGRLNEFIFEYVDNHRDEMNVWELNDFIENFDIDNKIFNEYLDQLDLNHPISPKSKSNLKHYFKALMARTLFDDTGYFMVTQSKDNMILKVLELEENSEQPIINNQ
ncbi:MAG: peptidase S41, partial [Bacteroidetes bacterium]|nr:peptidase S41 [Bacteroidota bacterium]